MRRLCQHLKGWRMWRKNLLDYMCLTSLTSYRHESKISVSANLSFYRVVGHKNLSGTAPRFRRRPNQLIFSVIPFGGVRTLGNQCRMARATLQSMMRVTSERLRKYFKLSCIVTPELLVRVVAETAIAERFNTLKESV